MNLVFLLNSDISMKDNTVKTSDVFRENFSTCLNEAGVKSLFRQNTCALWSSLSEQINYLPVSYTNESIEYQMAYLNGDDNNAKNGSVIVDISILLYNDNVPCGFWPISISRDISGISLSTFGDPVSPPIFISNLSHKSSKRITRLCIEALFNFIEKNKVDGAIDYSSDNIHHELGEWHKTLMNKGAELIVQHELFVDLSLSLKEIKANIRKSYKPISNVIN